MTTKRFLSVFGMQTLRDLPDIEALEDAGLLNRDPVQSDNFRSIASATEASVMPEDDLDDE